MSWIKPGGQHHNGHMLEVTHINRTQGGKYKCEASNECGNATKTATINVQCKYIQKLSFVTCCFLYFFDKGCQFASLYLFLLEACLFVASASAR